MLSNILPSCSGSSYIIKTSGIHLTWQGISWPVFTFFRHLFRVYIANPFSVYQYNPYITSLFPTSKTSASITNLPNIEEKSITLNEVYTTRFPPYQLPSFCLTSTFLALFHIPNWRTRHFSTTKALATVSMTASTSCSPRCMLTINRGVLWGVRPKASKMLFIHGPNPLLNQALWSSGISYWTSSSSELVLRLHC